ncbi:MAG: hypothetical protein ACYC0V_06380 [Armatimonadota bacterium]
MMVFHGVGGIGKTTFINHLGSVLDKHEPKVPHASCSLGEIKGFIDGYGYHKVLLRLRHLFKENYGIDFPTFDLYSTVILAYEGKEIPLIKDNPILYWIFQIILDKKGVPTAGFSQVFNELVRKNRKVEEFIRKIGGTRVVIELRKRVTQQDQTLLHEHIQKFASDLKNGQLRRKHRRSVIFLDSYEEIWYDDRLDSSQSKSFDEWVRMLAEYCIGESILLVIGGREKLTWEPSEWNRYIESHAIGGFLETDAQHFLSRLGVHHPPPSQPTELQSAIIQCCDCGYQDNQRTCHPLYLTLCAEIVLNDRVKNSRDTHPDVFLDIPFDQTADRLAEVFLKSLSRSSMELWVTELSLTPRFDEECALAIDKERMYNNGRAGWRTLIQYSFIERYGDGYYNLHKTMCDALMARITANDRSVLHKWYDTYWKKRGIMNLAWYHRWHLNPAGAIYFWKEMHDSALGAMDISKAHSLLDLWTETGPSCADRKIVGDELWALAHFVLGSAFGQTPYSRQKQVLKTAISHFEAALVVYNKNDYPYNRAVTQSNLGNAYIELLDNNWTTDISNLQKAKKYYKSAEEFITKDNYPYDWAGIQNNKGRIQFFEFCR